MSWMSCVGCHVLDVMWCDDMWCDGMWCDDMWCVEWHGV